MAIKQTIKQVTRNLRYALDNVCNTEPKTYERSMALDRYEYCLAELIQTTSAHAIKEVDRQLQISGKNRAVHRLTEMVDG